MVAIEALEAKSLENKIFLLLSFILFSFMLILGVSLIYNYQNKEKNIKNELLNKNHSKITRLIIEELGLCCMNR